MMGASNISRASKISEWHCRGVPSQSDTIDGKTVENILRAELWDTTSLENTMILPLMTQTTPQTRQREPYPTVYPFLKENVSATSETL